jgi:hypothetical protein
MSRIKRKKSKKRLLQLSRKLRRIKRRLNPKNQRTLLSR